MVVILLFILRLKDVIVKTGEKVILKQKIGTVVTSESNGETELILKFGTEKNLKIQLNGLQGE